MPDQSPTATHTRPRLRLAELIGALSLATDIGSGLPFGQGLRAALIAVRLSEEIGLREAEAAQAYYLAQLKYIGCTAESHVAAEVFGDELATGAWIGSVDLGRPTQVLTALARHHGKGGSPASRAGMVVHALAGMPRIMGTVKAHCEIAERLSERLALDADVQSLIGHLFERWDGRGGPSAFRREQLALPARVARLAQDAATFHRLGGIEAVIAMSRERAGGAHDPSLTDGLRRSAEVIFAGFDETVGWEQALAVEPGPRPMLSPQQLESGLNAIADFVDLKFPSLAGHSRGVARLAGEAGRRLKMPTAEVVELERAALLHDLGRVGVSASVWVKPGRLSEDDWEKIRLHPYYTERLLSRPPLLERLGALAALHHERLDGSGYHRRSVGAQLPFAARLLAAADSYQAMTEPRAHRDAMGADAAAEQLRREGRQGRLDSEAVTAVTGAAGHVVTARRRSWPDGLSDREVEVLRLVARGLSDREIAGRLHISRKTVGHHVEHLYDKTAVSTRPGAALYAMQHELLRPDD